MNERILELYQQAAEFAYKNISKESWNTDYFHAVVSRKFAELIILECASLFPQTFTDEQYQRRIDKSIKKHFGV